MKYKFNALLQVEHVKTGSVYMIVGTPDKLMLESSCEPAYAYQLANDKDAKIWVRSQSEMEDGRFIALGEG